MCKSSRDVALSSAEDVATGGGDRRRDKVKPWQTGSPHFLHEITSALVVKLDPLLKLHFNVAHKHIKRFWLTSSHCCDVILKKQGMFLHAKLELEVKK